MLKKNKFYLIAGVVLSVIIIAALFNRQGVEAETVTVTRGDIVTRIKDSGIIQAGIEKNIYAPQNATIDDLSVEIGQKVAENQVLAVLKNPTLNLNLAEAKANLAQVQANLAAAETAVKQTELQLKDAEAELKRITILFKEGAVNKVELEKAESLVKSLKASLNRNLKGKANTTTQINELQEIITQLQENQAQLLIKSPVNGIILDLPIKTGQTVPAGTLLAVIGNTDKLEVKADILSDDLAQVKVGQKVIITSPVLDSREIEGTVEKIYPRAEEKQSALGVIQRRVPVIISLKENANLQPGYEVTIGIETQHRQDVLVIPREAIRTTDKGQLVMQVVKGKVKYQSVETGLSDSENIEITKGLKEGALIVKNGNLDLKENTKV